MRVLVENLLSGKKFELAGAEMEVERALRSHFPGVCSSVDIGDLGGVIHEVGRLPYVALGVLEGPVPRSQPHVDYHGLSYGMHEGDDPWPREADEPRDPGDPAPVIVPYVEKWEDVLD